MSIESVMNGTYRGKVEFWHKGNGVYAARNNYESTEFVPSKYADFMELKETAEKALDDKRRENEGEEIDHDLTSY